MNGADYKLFHAATAGDLRAAERALNEGANVDCVMEAGGNSAFLEACYNGGNVELVRLLIKRGASIDFRNGVGGRHASALMCAAYKGHYDIVDLLLQVGANPHFRTESGGHTAESFALNNGHTKVAALIKSPLQREEVVMSRPLRENSLEEIFNFASLERISLLRNPKGDVVAMTREQFSVLEDSPDLEKAFELYKSRGGKKNEVDVFPNKLFKPSKGL